MALFAIAPTLRTPFGLLAPYCGEPPSPSGLLHRWNLDPVLIAVLALIAAIYFGRARSVRESGWRRAAFHVGWVTAVLALISPLCPLSVSLFSARVGQHMLLTTVAAPLIALGRPERVAPVAAKANSPLAAALAFAVLLWVWHAPGPYAATFASDVIYWAMHVSLFGTALWLWIALLNGSGDRPAGQLAAILLTTSQMGLLGALITFAGTPLYWPHAFTAAAWGLSPLEDQQLGGVLMWVPAGVILVICLGIAFAETLRRAESRALARSVP